MQAAHPAPGPRLRGRDTRGRSASWERWRWLLSWALALGLVGFGLPRAVDVSWHGVLPVLGSVRWPAVVALSGLWLLGLWLHTFVLTSAAPQLTHRQALALNVTGSAVSNVVPLGGAAGAEVNRRMMRAWGIDTRTFAGYTILTNVWDVAMKLLLPLVGVAALARAGEAVLPQLQAAAWVATLGFVVLGAATAALLLSARGAVAAGRATERLARKGLRLVGRDRELGIADALPTLRRECATLVATGWLRMSFGITGYVATQYLLLASCLWLTGGHSTWAQVLAAFAVERVLTVVPVTPGGVGVADLGLVGVLLATGGDPTAVTAAAVLYRLFIFAVDIPVGGGTLGLWLVGQRWTARRRARVVRPTGQVWRVAHVTDVFLPRLGGIETHVDDLVRHQRDRGLDAQVLTPTAGTGNDPAWVHRMPLRQARRAVGDYDVVHVHVSMLSPYGVAVARAAASAGIPTLVTVHSMWTGAGGVLRLAALAGLRRWPTTWSAVSEAAATVFRCSVGGLEVAVLPNALDVASWRTPRATTPDDARRPTTVVSVMRLMRRKRPVSLLRMFEQARALAPEEDLRLVIVGDGPRRKGMERYVRRHGLEPFVQITGRLSRPEVLAELRAASIYVAPAIKESFGIAALEARCAGLPVVAHRRSGVREFIRDRVEGILVDDDTEMAVAIADLAGDQSLRTRIATHNQDVVPRFDWSDMLDRTTALYQTAVDRVSVADPQAAPEPVAAAA